MPMRSPGCWRSATPRRPAGYRVQLVPVADDAAGEFRPFMLALLGAVLVLVLVLAVNTATLLLLKAVARAREIAVRAHSARARVGWPANW